MGARGLILSLAAAGLALASPQAKAQDDAALVQQGHAVFNQLSCTTCHLPDEFDQAPPLAGVYGRKIAGAPDWPYCAALKAKGGAWDDAALDAFLTDTQAFAPGCVMNYKVSDAGKRKALVAYLKSLK